MNFSKQILMSLVSVLAIQSSVAVRRSDPAQAVVDSISAVSTTLAPLRDLNLSGGGAAVANVHGFFGADPAKLLDVAHYLSSHTECFAQLEGFARGARIPEFNACAASAQQVTDSRQKQIQLEGCRRSFLPAVHSNAGACLGAALRGGGIADFRMPTRTDVRAMQLLSQRDPRRSGGQLAQAGRDICARLQLSRNYLSRAALGQESLGEMLRDSNRSQITYAYSLVAGAQPLASDRLLAVRSDQNLIGANCTNSESFTGQNAESARAVCDFLGRARNAAESNYALNCQQESEVVHGVRPAAPAAR